METASRVSRAWVGPVGVSLAVAVILGVLYLFPSRPAEQASSVPWQEQVAVLSEQKTIFPPYAESKTIRADVLPSELAWTLVSDAVRIAAWAVTYEGGATGFVVQYRVPAVALSELFARYGSSGGKEAGWSVLAQGRTERFALYQTENPTYRVSITLSRPGNDTNVAVAIKTQY